MNEMKVGEQKSKSENSLQFLATKMNFVPIPAELNEHVDSEVGVIAELSAAVGMESRRNVHQFHKFEQMAANTFREPWCRGK